MTITSPYLANYWVAASKCPNLIRINQYAKQHHLNTGTVRKYILQGKLIGLKTGHKWYVLASDEDK